MSPEEYIKLSRSGEERKSILTLRIPENKKAGNPSEWLVSYFSNIETLPENVSTAGQWFVLWSPLPCFCTTANFLKAGISLFGLWLPSSQHSALNIIGTQNAWGACQFSSVAQSRPTLCDPMNHSTPGLPVHHQLAESTQTHVHWVGDAIQPSHPLLSPSPPALNLSQHVLVFTKVWFSYLSPLGPSAGWRLMHD